MNIDYRPLLPYFALTTLGLLVVLLDTYLPRHRSHYLGWIVGFGTALTALLDAAGPDRTLWDGLIVFDSFARAFDLVFLTTLGLVTIAAASVEGRMKFAGEYYALMIFSTMGLMLMASAGGLLVLYLGLELSTVCLFALVGFTKRDRRSAEAALKMLVLGASALVGDERSGDASEE